MWMDDRREHFEHIVQAAGCTCNIFTALHRRRAAPLEEEQQALAHWLRGLPRPTGIIAGNDEWGQRVLDACRRAGICVPEEVAVIGADNDEYLCNLSNPPLSSVDMNTEQVGYEAAALLARMMAGEPAPAQPVLLPPRGVVQRTSSDILAIEDQELAAVIRFIREHACEGLRLKELLRKSKLSRRTLQRRLRAVLGRSPKEEILRVQLQSAKGLLTETDLPASTIAERCGFRDPCYFNRIFQAKVGLPPGAYRRNPSRKQTPPSGPRTPPAA
jgi:LacI family transcriptional regulator